MTHLARRYKLFLALSLVAALSPAWADELPAVREVLSGGDLTWELGSDMLGARLVMKAPSGSVVRRSFGPEEALVAEPLIGQGRAPLDGWYRYELKIWSAGGSIVKEHTPGRDRPAPGLQVLRILGTFRVEGGWVVEVSSSPTEVLPGEALRDQVVGDDLVVDRLCAGVECVDGEPFGSEQVKVKDSAPVVTFEDTSAGPAATTDWQLVANETAEEFSLNDLDAATRPIVVEAGSPTGSLHLDALGRLGLGTSVPGSQLQIDGAAPEVRIEDDLSAVGAGLEVSAGSLQLEGNSDQDLASFDVTAPADSMVVTSAGALGLGTATPDTALHLERSDGSARLKVEDTGTPAIRTLFELENNGGLRFTFLDSSINALWEFSNKNGKVIFNRGAGVNELELEPDGDLVISGDLTASGMVYPSSRELKTDFEAVDGQEVLERLSSMPISEWSYKADDEKRRHIGPVAEDFAAAFGVGADESGLNVGDVAGLTLAAVQGLAERLRQAEERIEALEIENTALRLKEDSTESNAPIEHQETQP